MATPRSRATGTGVTKLPPTDNGGVDETLGENREEKCETSVLLGLHFMDPDPGIELTTPSKLSFQTED